MSRHHSYESTRHFRRAERPVLKLVTPPAEQLLTTDDLRAHLRIDDDADDAQLATYLAAAIGMLDGPEGRLSRALVSQEWEQRQRGPSFGRVEVLLGPDAKLTGVSYIDKDDRELPLEAGHYRLIDLGDTAYVEPRKNQVWPSDMDDRPDALRVRYIAGQPAAEVPETIKQAIRLIVGHWYEQREATAVVEMKEIPIGAETLINISRIHGFVS